ncbi:N-acetylmuramoyl-L-alanine amidase [Alphaproteobacteria bacterium LSUCC0719]
MTLNSFCHISRLLGLAVFTALLLVSSVVQAADTAITGLRIGGVEINGQQALRVVIETDRPVPARLTLLADPYRFVVDIPDAGWRVDGVPTSGKVGSAPATAYRFGRPDPQTGRVVVELSAPAAPVRRFALAADNGRGHRLVFDLADTGLTGFQVAAKTLAREGFHNYDDASSSAVSGSKPPSVTAAPAASSQPTRSQAPSKAAKPSGGPAWTVFIDAGHGGKDPGAIGTTRTPEKQITLAAAKELARQLEATGVVRPILSRADDRYLKLRQRINLARQQQADIFISLHADAAPSSKANGISVFTLSDTASDKEAELLARNENRADLIGGPDLAVEDPEVGDELLRMFQRESMNQSTYLASAILQQVRDMPGGDRRGHRFAGFAVLKAPDMPSVLVEMGFITNRRDEANLKTAEYRTKLAKRLAKAIVAYLDEYGPRE